MKELIDELRKIYVEKFSESLPAQRILIFFVYLFAQVLVLSKTSQSSFVRTIYDMSIEDAAKTLPLVTFGNLMNAVILTSVTFYLYGFIKEKVFMYLSHTQGFSDVVQRWKERTAKVKSRSAEHNELFALEIRERINAKRKSISAIHVFGEIFCSLSLILLLSVASSFNTTDLICFLLTLMLLFLAQQRSYIVYLSKLLPDLVSEAVFLGSDFSHKEAYEKNIAETTTTK